MHIAIKSDKMGYFTKIISFATTPMMHLSQGNFMGKDKKNITGTMFLRFICTLQSYTICVNNFRFRGTKL